jgi:hypothetical protein
MRSLSWGVRREGRLRLFPGVREGGLGSPDTKRVFELCGEVDLGGPVAWTFGGLGLAFEVDEAVARA